MSASVTVRPMTADDVDASVRIHAAAISLVGATAWPTDESQARFDRLWLSHLQRTDPGGAWIAECDDALIGLGVALIRDRLWVGSVLAVDPAWQGRGIGHRLFDRMLHYGAACTGAMLTSSPDPRAMRRYVLAGLRANPCLAADGTLDRRSLPAVAGARAGALDDDRDLVDSVSRRVRNAAHGPDLDALLAVGGELVVFPKRGYAVHRDGDPVLLAATDDDAARALLWTCLACAPPSARVHVGYISQGNAWATDVAVRAGLSLSPCAPVFARGDVGPLAPWLPTGAYL
jgi:GNAT superfamily N-acetyltransferase